MNTTTTSRNRLRRGLSLPEIMIGFAITVLLLTATAAAFNASAQAVSMNDMFFRASQSARVSLNQLMVEIRRCDAVSVNTTYVDIIRPAEDLTPGEVFRRFSYDSAGQKLTIQIFQAGNVGGPVRTVATNVTGVTFGPADLVRCQPGVGRRAGAGDRDGHRRQQRDHPERRRGAEAGSKGVAANA